MELTQTVKAFVAGFREAVVAERQNAEPRVIRALALIVFISVFDYGVVDFRRLTLVSRVGRMSTCCNE